MTCDVHSVKHLAPGRVNVDILEPVRSTNRLKACELFDVLVDRDPG